MSVGVVTTRVLPGIAIAPLLNEVIEDSLVMTHSLLRRPLPPLLPKTVFFGSHPLSRSTRSPDRSCAKLAADGRRIKAPRGTSEAGFNP